MRRAAKAMPEKPRMLKDKGREKEEEKEEEGKEEGAKEVRSSTLL